MTDEPRKFDNTKRFRNLYLAISVYRKRKDLTQDQLAEILGVSRQHIGSIEALNMADSPSLDLLFNIATVLDIEPYMLLKFDPEKQT